MSGFACELNCIVRVFANWFMVYYFDLRCVTLLWCLRVFVGLEGVLVRFSGADASFGLCLGGGTL